MISTDVADVRNPLGHCRLLLGLFLLNLFLHMPHVISEKAAWTVSDCCQSVVWNGGWERL